MFSIYASEYPLLQDYPYERMENVFRSNLKSHNAYTTIQLHAIVHSCLLDGCHYPGLLLRISVHSDKLKNRLKDKTKIIDYK